MSNLEHLNISLLPQNTYKDVTVFLFLWLISTMLNRFYIEFIFFYYFIFYYGLLESRFKAKAYKLYTNLQWSAIPESKNEGKGYWDREEDKSIQRSITGIKCDWFFNFASSCSEKPWTWLFSGQSLELGEEPTQSWAQYSCTQM